MKKTKIFAITLAAVLLVVSAVGSTLAWFTATDQEINEMELKNLQVDIYEEFGNHYEVIPGTDVQKNPMIINNSQSEIDEYVRVSYDVANYAKTAYATSEVYMTITMDADGDAATTDDITTNTFYELVNGVVTPVAAFDQAAYDAAVAEYDAYKAAIAAGDQVNYNYKSTIGYVYDEDLANSFAANAGTPEYTAWVASIEAAIDDIITDAIAEQNTPNLTWYDGGDGYYYYNGVLEYGAENGVYFFEHLFFDGDVLDDSYQNVNFDIIITAEAIQAQGTYTFGDVAGLAAAWDSFNN